MLYNGTISCPFCRKNSVLTDPATLLNNSYALHMVKLAEKQIRNNNNIEQ